MKAILVETAEQREAVFAIREAVFVKEQGVAADLEFDEYEEVAEHWLITQNDQPVGCGRLRIVNNQGKLERICVQKEARGQHVGQFIVRTLERSAQEKGVESAYLHGQTQAEGFYHSLGYETCSAVFLEDAIPHVIMKKKFV
ncbi:GNAT family acetyltransferase [Fictibacillus macauensis ZFHKF-1]|uniref:GNAT family acetyltransferase n=1 Tax=Fictibacillus macauensis ZFHKF-1 TaxID=1196324 RepID=I8UIK4_9BACL|nr:GNAT family N-acetyltransferase [Fictibacillus macauensis]EIT86725.1 GNAT family acetyltransferase [Fictibacillus macauensis ZFHKF-1]